MIESIPVSGPISMLTGQGGNLAVYAGSDGIFLVDDQFAPLTDKIRAAIAQLGDAPIRFVFNTHWHGDHTGGNENLGRAGALIVAHDNVRVRMATEQISEIWNRTTPPSPAVALPVVTFEGEVSFHLAGEEIRAFHVPPAHTDGDAVVHFRRSNVIHTGDIFFNGLYPFVDTDSGGHIDGVIAACEEILELCDANTRIIPGHGPLASRDDLVTYHDLLRTIRDRIADRIARGETLEQVQAAHPTAEWDGSWGQAWLTGEKFTEILYRDLAGQ